ncbi:Hint domain-containing protein [Paracoccus homiensis]|uniref:Hint domain-containing protein n=1 Tax=Paracoccus homiensis TaxID=364199 RepID=UPI00398C84CB
MPTTWDAIYLGTVGFDIDPTEGNQTSENAALLVGQTFGSVSDPLLRNIVSVGTEDNRGFAGVLDTNRGTGNSDKLLYDIGNGPQAVTFEGGAVYQATINFTDGTSTSSIVVLVQDENGNLFFTPARTEGPLSQAYSQKPIQSLTVDSLVQDFGNLSTDRSAGNFVTCFLAGTMIATPDGPRPVEEIVAGDLVDTQDNGPQVVRWSGSRRIERMADNLKPVRIHAGALGVGLPARDLLVSQQHRVLVRSKIARRMFGADEVLVAAKHLLALPGVEIAEDVAHPVYCHLLFDDHQLVLSNGAVTESLFTGPEALKGVSEAARREILTIFPQLAETGAAVEAQRPARPLITGRLGRKLAERHLSNDRPLVSIN